MEQLGRRGCCFPLKDRDVYSYSQASSREPLYARNLNCSCSCLSLQKPQPLWYGLGAESFSFQCCFGFFCPVPSPSGKQRGRQVGWSQQPLALGLRSHSRLFAVSPARSPAVNTAERGNIYACPKASLPEVSHAYQPHTPFSRGLSLLCPPTPAAAPQGCPRWPGWGFAERNTSCFPGKHRGEEPPVLPSLFWS